MARTAEKKSFDEPQSDDLEADVRPEDHASDDPHGRADAGGSPREFFADARLGEHADPAGYADDGQGEDGEGAGGFVRNLLVATATIPFVFLLVLMAGVFMFGGAEPAPSADAGAARVKIAVDSAAPRPAPQSPLAQPGRADSAGATPALWAAASADAIPTAVPAGGEVVSVGIDGERLALLVNGTQGQSVVIYHVARGEVVTQIRLGGADAQTDPALNDGAPDAPSLKNQR